MNKSVSSTACLILAGLLFSHVLAWAADEDIAVSVYLAYDPVTGSLTEQAKPKTGHAPAIDISGETVEQSVSPEVENAQAVTQLAAQTGQADNMIAQTASEGPAYTLPVLAAIVVIVLIIGFLVLKNRQKLSS